MAEQRRALIEGLAQAANDPSKEAEFLANAKSSTGARAMSAAAAAASGVTLNTRIDPNISTALKRASLQRKLEGVEPNSLRNILEEALTPWLRGNGYL